MARHHAHSARRTPIARPALAVVAAAVALIATGCAQSPSPSGSAPSSQDGDGTRAAGSTPASEEGASKEEPDSSRGSEPSSAPATVPTADGRSPAHSAPRTGGFPRCSPGTLSLSVRHLEAGAGNRYAALVFTNTSQEPCRSRGWPGLQLHAKDGSKIPTTTKRDGSVPSKALTLKPNDRAWSRLHWTVVPGTGDSGDGSCPQPSSLRAIPPDERGSLAAGWKLGTVCGGGEIEATALRTGDGAGH